MSLCRFGCLALAVFLGIAAVARPSRSATAQDAGLPCRAWDIEYQLAAKLRVSDTPMGAGNDTHTIGPGSVVLRFADVNGKPGGAVRMRSYTMHEHLSIEARALFWKTHVLTDTKTVATPNACGDAARGELERTTLRWTTSVSGYRADGTLTCEGSMCGSFGAPPPGKSEVHIPPRDVTFSSFVFATDMKTFVMPSTLVSKTESPKQTSHVALAGREAHRTCVVVDPPCP